MIRSQKLPTELLEAWFTQIQESGTKTKYCLRAWKENRSNFKQIKDYLSEYINEIFSDSKEFLRKGFEDEISPFFSQSSDPAANYPAMLHRKTLQGYWGEILSGLIVEHWGSNGKCDWIVPAFLFRFHQVEFQHLGIINQRIISGSDDFDPDAESEIRPGRTGDDCLAFRMDSDGNIVEVLTLEGKCIKKHRSETVEMAHKKLSEELWPTGINELIMILRDYDSIDANKLRVALLDFRSKSIDGIKRSNGILYACGSSPLRGQNRTWLPTDQPNTAYRSSLTLDCMEVQFEEIDDLINIIFRGSCDG